MNVGFKVFLALFSFPLFTQATCPDATALLERGHKLRQQGQYLLSAEQYSLVTALSCHQEEKLKAQYFYANSLYLLGETHAAESILNDLPPSDQGSATYRKAQMLKGWINLDSRKHLSSVDQQAFNDFEKLKIDIEQNQKLKKPWLAGTLSAVVPGLGQVYNENYTSAAFSLILNALFLSAALELQRENLQASALAAGAVFSITYTGSILGSIESSRQINRAYQAPMIEEARRKSLPQLDF